MAIKFAFSTVAVPELTLDQVATQAKELGYEGVELRTLGPGGGGLASDPSLSEPQKVADVFREAGVEPICLSTSVSLHHKKTGDAHRAFFEAQRYLEIAAEMNCPAVRVFGYEVGPGENHRAVIHRIADRAAQLADKAGELGVQLLFENAGSLVGSKEWWWLLDMVNHPMLGMVWNVANSVAANPTDAGGWVSVSTLNSRIRIAKVKDTNVGQGTGYVQLGDGDVGIPTFMKRLLGIGFDGYVTVEWDRLWLDTLAPPEEFLPEAVNRLRGWVAQIDEESAKGVESREKAEAKLHKEREKALAKASGADAPAKASS